MITVSSFRTLKIGRPAEYCRTLRRCAVKMLPASKISAVAGTWTAATVLFHGGALASFQCRSATWTPPDWAPKGTYNSCAYIGRAGAVLDDRRSSSGLPDASDTGVPPGVTLTPSGSITIDTPGAVVSGLDVTGEVVITAPSVTLENCRVAATSWGAIVVQAPGAVIENCEISSIYSNGGTKGVLFDDSATGGVVRGCDIHDVEDGVYISTRSIVVEDNYIHDLNSTGADPHYDGIQLHGGVTSDVTIQNNSVLVADSANSAITMGVVQNIQVDGNRLSGGGYTIHVDGRFGEGAVSDVSITNNRFGSHTFGNWTFERATPALRGNLDDLTGRPIP